MAEPITNRKRDFYPFVRRRSGVVFIAEASYSDLLLTKSVGLCVLIFEGLWIRQKGFDISDGHCNVSVLFCRLC